ncbi:MAG: prephenate dehydratase [Firmicutes bacterium]|nr:prephenate dehydratase [Bacillota bacterium]
MCAKLAYLGPPGTFSEEAAIRFAGGKSISLVPCAGIDTAIAAVEQKKADLGIVPVENSLEGSVNLTLDLLRHSSAQIRAEILLPVRHCLLAQKGETLSGIKEVRSHPQALAQCRHSLAELLPGIPVRETVSTAEAACLAAQHPGLGVVASRHAAARYGLNVLREDLQDEKGNVTRFLILAAEDAPPTGDDKTSLLLGLPDRPGSLHDLLGVVANHGLNLTKIESRPIRGDLGKYIFFLDIQGHRRDKNVALAISEMRNRTLFLKILGSYPRASFEDSSQK